MYRLRYGSFYVQALQHILRKYQHKIISNVGRNIKKESSLCSKKITSFEMVQNDILTHYVLYQNYEFSDFSWNQINDLNHFNKILSTYTQATNSSKIHRLRCSNCSMAPMGNHSKKVTIHIATISMKNTKL